MIQLSPPGKSERSILLNPHLIEYIEGAGVDRTAILLTTGKRFVVTESAEEIRDMIISYRKKIGLNAQEE